MTTLHKPRGEARRDAYPEGTDYKDRGCQLAPACLSCPFDRCHDDRPASDDREERWSITALGLAALAELEAPRSLRRGSGLSGTARRAWRSCSTFIPVGNERSASLLEWLNHQEKGEK